jgi:transposase
MGKQKTYSKEFKFKVAIEMIKGDLTIAEIISKYQVPRSVLSKWKNYMQR